MASLVNKRNVFLNIFYLKRNSVLINHRRSYAGLRRHPLNVFSATEADEFHRNKEKPWEKRSSTPQIHINDDVPDDVDFKTTATNKVKSQRHNLINHNNDVECDDEEGEGSASFGWLEDHDMDNVKQKGPNVEKINMWKSFSSDIIDDNLKVNEKTYDEKSKMLETPLYRYTRLEQGDKRFTSAVIQAKGKQAKIGREKTILLEGLKLINDAHAAGLKINSIYFDTVSTLNKLKLGDTGVTQLYKVRTARMKVLSEMANPPGVMAIAQKPHFDVHNQNASPLVLVVDNIRDPGDMGTLIRTAGVAGCQVVIVMKGCVDVWNSKVLRAGAGVHFHLPIVTDVMWQHVGNYLPDKTYVSLIHNYFEIFNRRLSAFHDIEESRALYEDQNKYVYVDEENKIGAPDLSFSKENVKLYERIPIPQVNLFDMDIGTHEHVTCVISGELKGASGGAKKLLYDNSGEEVFISSSADKGAGLSASITGCVVLMEAKRQLYNKGLIQMEEQSDKLNEVDSDLSESEDEFSDNETGS